MDGCFSGLVQDDIKRVNWTGSATDNLFTDEHLALRELQETDRLVVKKSDKGGNVVLLSEDQYKNEVGSLLANISTYKKLYFNPFS